MQAGEEIRLNGRETLLPSRVVLAVIGKRRSHFLTVIPPPKKPSRIQLLPRRKG